ncbi:hypothetical protein Q7P37_002904 [Cladosporium fusiforme]
MRSLPLLYALLHFLGVHTSLLPNTKSSFPSSPEPFAIDVDPSFMESIRQRVNSTRKPAEPAGVAPNNADGPLLATFTSMQEFWVNSYDWNDAQASINQKLNQFTTTVFAPASDYAHPVSLHFVHHRSLRKDAIPLLFVHGWPGSFLEVEHIIDRLTNPPNTSVPAFHVVAPSIPGFGFLPAPEFVGFGPSEAGHAFNALMEQLNYTKYVYQGGDIGALIMRFQAISYPDNLVSALSNFWIVQPNQTDLARYANNETTSEETTYMRLLLDFQGEGAGYLEMQRTQPLTISYLQTDSPLGFALWIYSYMRNAVDPQFTHWSLEDVITWSLMYTIQGPYGGSRMYKELARAGVLLHSGIGNPGYMKQPAAITQRPYDVGYRQPLAWAQRQGNVKERYVHHSGGHFAAWETPDSLAQDIYRWFGNRALSGTAIIAT